MPTCSRQILVKDHAFLVKPAYYLKSLYGVRGFCVCDISVVAGYFQKYNSRKVTQMTKNGNVRTVYAGSNRPLLSKSGNFTTFRH